MTASRHERAGKNGWQGWGGYRSLITAPFGLVSVGVLLLQRRRAALLAGSSTITPSHDRDWQLNGRDEKFGLTPIQT